MAHINRGKDFEKVVKECLSKDCNTSVYRLYDTTNGFSGIANISDFIVYHYPIQYFIECKCHYGNTFPLSCITDTQYNGMLEQSKIQGVKCGILLWLIDKDYTCFIPISEIDKLKRQGVKSVNIKALLNNDIWHIPIKGEKKRIFFDYDFSTLFQF